MIVPTTISRSLWRGENRGNSAPKRARSYFGPATDMNSMPQHAVTNGYVNSENLRPQLLPRSSERLLRPLGGILETRGGELYSHPIAFFLQT